MNFQRSLAKNQAGNSRGTPRGITGIFFRGGKVILPDCFPDVKCFFPVENSNFGTPKTNFRRRQKWKAKKKKKKKKGSSPLFIAFPTLPVQIFHFPFHQFPSLLLNFYPFSFFTQYVSKNFPVRSLWGHPAPPACYTTGHTFEAPH